MNSKQLKFLQTFEDMSQMETLSEADVIKYLKAFINIDFAFAVDVWDYLVTTREEALAEDEGAAGILGTSVLNLMYGKGAQKTVKVITELTSVRKAVYQYSASATEGNAFAILVDLLNSNKVAPAEEIFKCLVRNDRINYGPALKAILERLFIEILKKNPAKKLEMPRKLSSLLLTYVSKIKTDERAMLEQRIKETI